MTASAIAYCVLIGISFGVTDVGGCVPPSERRPIIGLLQGGGYVAQLRARLTASRQRASIVSAVEDRGSKRRSACQCAAISSRDFHRLTVSPAR